MKALEELPKHFMTNIGPWEPQQFYDGEDAIKLPPLHLTNAYTDSLIHMATSNDTVLRHVIRPSSPSTLTIMPSETLIEHVFNKPEVTPTEEEEPYFFDPSNAVNKKPQRKSFPPLNKP